MIAYAPCKINIGLKILDKRGDGFHNIDSYFYAVPLYDIIEIQEDDHDSLIQTGIISTIKTEDNLVYKVLKLLRDNFYLPPIHIHLHKQIPIQAGLGGGSSDATNMLKLLNTYFNLKISAKELFNMALSLGSDCPYFLHPNPARVQGRGEIVLPESFDLKLKYIVIVKPPFSVSTKEAFSSHQENKTEKLKDISHLSFGTWPDVFINDFEKAVISIYPSILEIKKSFLKASAFYISLSGSGSAVFGLFHSPVDLVFPSSYFVWKGQLQ